MSERTRELVVNADDLGMSAGINRGIARAFEDGIVTSASLMVRWPGAAEAAAYARTHPELAVGLHVDLGEWIYRDGEWAPRYVVVPDGDDGATRAELDRQLGAFRDLVGSDPTHLDSHQHVHRDEPARSAILDAGRSLGIPVRELTSHAAYRGEFYGQTAEGAPLPAGVGTDRLLEILAGLPHGVTELGVHPGFAGDVDTPYGAERELEVRALCDPRVAKAIEELGIRLLSFADVGAARS